MKWDKSSVSLAGRLDGIVFKIYQGSQKQVARKGFELRTSCMGEQ